MACPVCNYAVDKNAQKCPNCDWEIQQYLHVNDEDRKQLEQARKIWQKKQTFSNKDLQRDPFETWKEYDERLKNYGQIQAGEAELLAKKYDIDTGVFPLRLVWKKWIKAFNLPEKKAHIVIPRNAAKALYSMDEKQPIFVTFQVINRRTSIVNASIQSSKRGFYPLRYGQGGKGGLLHVLKHKGSNNDNYIEVIAFSPNGKWLATSTYRYTYLREAENGKTIHTLMKATDLAFSLDSRMLVIASGTRIYLYDTISGKKTTSAYSGQYESITSICFSKNSPHLLLTTNQYTVKHFNIRTSKWTNKTKRIKKKGHTLITQAPNGLIALSKLTALDFYNANFHALKKRTETQNNLVALAFSIDSTYLFSASKEEPVIRIWNTSSFSEEQLLSGHTGGIHCLAVSPNGQYLASGSVDNTIKFWSIGTSAFKELLTLRGHMDTVNSVAFSPDGKRLASGSKDTTVRIWDVDTILKDTNHA